MNSKSPHDKSNIKYRLMEEMRSYATISLYLWVCFSVLLLYETAILRAENIPFLPIGTAVVKALILGKFILIGKAVKVGERIESDVCICQSALGLLDKGYRVVILEDAVGSPHPCHDQGINRMRDAGVILSSVKGTFYEWQRNVDRGNSIFGDVYDKQAPKGVYL